MGKKLIILVVLVIFVNLFIEINGFDKRMGNSGNDDDDDNYNNLRCRNDYDCFDTERLCEIGKCKSRRCEYTPKDCSDNDQCTVNERCDIENGACIYDIHPSCMKSPCQYCCDSNPIFNEQILIANRGDKTTTIVYAETEELRSTVIHGSDSEPLYINAPGCCGDDLPDGESRFFWVGDRLNNKVRKIDARTLNEVASLPTCEGVFHMYYHLRADQLWVVCDITKAMTVIQMSTVSVLQASITIPYDLFSLYQPHDITLTSTHAIVSLLGASDSSIPSYLIKYSLSTFTEVDRLQVPANAHLYFSGIDGDFLFVASQQGNKVSSIDPNTFTIKSQYEVPNAHGIWEQSGVVYVANIGAMDATGHILLDNNSPINILDTLWLFSYDQNGILNLIQGSPFPLPERNPHNIVPTLSRDKLFIAYTASNKLSVCDLNINGTPQIPCRLIDIPIGQFGEPKVESPGLVTPMGITRIKPLCNCETSCVDFDPCTMNEVCDMYQHQCTFETNPYCTSFSNDTCPHTVEIDINDHSELSVIEHPNHIFEFCQTSTYLGKDSALVLGFSPYDNCNLNKRGTCDNRESVHRPPTVHCVDDAELDICGQYSGGHALYLPPFANKLIWNKTHHKPTFDENEMDGTAHLQGLLYQENNPNLELTLNLWLSQRTDAYNPPVNAPKLELLDSCYKNNGGNIDPSSWIYYQNITGTLIATPGSAYEGLHISLSLNTLDHYIQIGYGANGKNLYLGLSGWIDWVVNNQPTDPYKHVSAQTQRGDINVDLNYCPYDFNYCDLFHEPQENHANGWEVTLNNNTLTYCGNFTVDDLLRCRAYDDPNTRLFNYSSVDYIKEYTGKLYSTSLVPENCYGINECKERVVFDTNYHIKITLDSHGIASITASSYLGSDTHLKVEWLRNVWLTGEDKGNLKVVLRTKVKHIETTDQYPYTTKLTHPLILSDQETGYPIEFESSDAPPCDNQGDYCVQEWCLRTYGADHVEDFSGFKPLQFTLSVHDEKRLNISVNVNLKAKHIGSQQHLTGKIDAALQLYRDREFQESYDCEAIHANSFIDCEPVFGVLRLVYQQHLRLRIKKAYLCYSLEGDLLPFDPHNPLTTGCNTPNIGAVHKLLYSTEQSDQQYVEQTLHQFMLLFDPPYGPHQVGFKFTSHAFTQFKQTVQIHWYAEEDGGDGGMISRITEYELDDGSKYQEKHDHSYDHSDYSVKCEYGKVYDWTYHQCKDPYTHDLLAYILIILALIFVVGLIWYLLFGCCCCKGDPKTYKNWCSQGFWMNIPLHHDSNTILYQNVNTNSNNNINNTEINNHHYNFNQTNFTNSTSQGLTKRTVINKNNNNYQLINNNNNNNNNTTEFEMNMSSDSDD